MTRNHSAHWPAARQNCSLQLLCLGQVRALGVLLSHAAGELRFLASSSDTTRHHLGGDLRPPLRDVRGHVAVGAPIPALLHAATLREEVK
jgi:hypothetical protein